MADECDQDRVSVLFDLAQAIFDDEEASDVVYVIGMLIAHAIKKQCTDRNPETTFALLREAVDLELQTQI